VVESVTTVSDGLANSLRCKYPGISISVFENGFEPADLCDLPIIGAFPADGKCRIAYLGTVYPQKSNPRPLFQAVSELAQDPDLSPLLANLEICFFGPDMGDVPQLINDYSSSR
jgi:hypothetical protein